MAEGEFVPGFLVDDAEQPESSAGPEKADPFAAALGFEAAADRYAK